MFDGFALDRVALSEVTLRVRHGGAGPPVLLLHGYPRTLRDDFEALYGAVLSIWRRCGADVRGRGLLCGHPMAKEAPELLTGELLAFLG